MGELVGLFHNIIARYQVQAWCAAARPLELCANILAETENGRFSGIANLSLLFEVEKCLGFVANRETPVEPRADFRGGPGLRGARMAGKVITLIAFLSVSAASAGRAFFVLSRPGQKAFDHIDHEDEIERECPDRENL